MNAKISDTGEQITLKLSYYELLFIANALHADCERAPYPHEERCRLFLLEQEVSRVTSAARRYINWEVK